MVHTFVPRRIGTTPYFDAEAWVGYGGPLLSSRDPVFVLSAISTYRAACRARKLVAEIIRFDPTLGDDRPFHGIPGFDIVDARQIAVVRLAASDEEQRTLYTPACRRRLRTGFARLKFQIGDAEDDWREYEQLYATSLQGSSAAARWYFSHQTFENLRSLPWACIATVRTVAREIVAAAMIVQSQTVGHSLLVASGQIRAHPGAGELLVHGIARYFAAKGCSILCLGGGGTQAPNDSLLRFKAKFTGGDLRSLPVGFVVHDQSAYAALVEDATLRAPVDAPLSELTRSLLPYRATIEYADPESLTDASCTRGGVGYDPQQAERFAHFRGAASSDAHE